MRVRHTRDLPTETPGARPGNERQIRLALVCYGGVSLSIYMHGVTKELHKLVVASRAFELESEINPFPDDTTEHVYWAVLRRLQDEDGIRRHLLIDVISGTSAGGINGMILAKALARNRSQDPLKKVWLRRADIGKLMGFGRVPALIKLPVWLIVGVVIPSTLALLSYFLPQGIRRWFRGLPFGPCRTRPPLSGKVLLKGLRRALSQMERSEPEVPPALPMHKHEAMRNSLVPVGHGLDLFITATDFHGLREEIWIADPPNVFDLRHRQVFRFHHLSGGEGALGDRFDDALAFAAAATSAFPGAFPPVTLQTLQRGSDRKADTKWLELTALRNYSLADVEPRDAYLIDGGVLDNFPFGHALAAIHRKPAGSEVKRRLLFIEPAPARSDSRPRSQPGWAATFWKAAFHIPREEPILDDLSEIRAFNERVRGISALVRDAIEASDEALAPHFAGFSGIRSERELEEWRRRMHQLVRENAGPGYDGYLHSKLIDVVTELASMASSLCDFPEGSNQAAFVRDVFLDWAGEEAILPGARISPELSNKQLTFLRTFDLGYKERRLRYLVAWINDLYLGIGDRSHDPATQPSRAELNALKAGLYERIAQLNAFVGGARASSSIEHDAQNLFDPELIRELVAGRRDAGQFARERRQAIDDLCRRVGTGLRVALKGFSWEVFRFIDGSSSSWEPSIHNEMLRRYLSFPLADAVTYPVVRVADVGELREIDVVRISPEDSKRLDPRGSSKLKGSRFFHFAAFFRASWRENDYLWGRLDGSERVVALLMSDLKGGDHDHFESEYALNAARAILVRERSLRRIRGLRSALRSRIEELNRQSFTSAKGSPV